VPLKKLGAPPFLVAAELENDDLLEIVSEPYIVSAEKSKFGRARGRANVCIIRTGEERRWTMNYTTWDRLVDAFGTQEAMWIGKKVKVRKEVQNVSGVDKDVIFGFPYKEPQQALDDKPLAETEIAEKVKGLSPESKKALLQTLQGDAEAAQ